MQTAQPPQRPLQVAETPSLSARMNTMNTPAPQPSGLTNTAPPSHPTDRMNARIPDQRTPDPLLQKAEALTKREVVTLHFDPFVAKQACLDGLSYLDAHGQSLGVEYPGFDLLHLRDLPELCGRILEQQRLLNRLKHAPTANPKELIAAALEWRRKLKYLGRSLAATGAIDSVTLTRLLSGFGHRNYAFDVLDLIELLTPHAALVETVCGPDAFELASRAAKAALNIIGFGTRDTLAIKEAVSLRDRYATLVERGHGRLRLAVAVVSSLPEALAVVGPLSTGARRKRQRDSAPELPK